MRKFLLGLVCCLVVVGLANMGHAFSFNFWGGGGGGHHRSHQNVTEEVNPPILPNYFNQYDDHHDVDTPNNPVFVGESNGLGTGGNFIADCGEDRGSPNPVPEPATIILLGAGLMGFAILGRKKFRY